ncbi:MAG: hypothetical protein J7L34_02095 [Thermotogaceae bacterium]|nr:hypothetical protein [Thermotogaceae bacterium]
MKEKIVLAVLGILYLIDGILYIKSGSVLWGFVIFTLAGVYLFGFERVYGGEVEHTKAHILAGGIFSILLTVFLIIERLVSYLSEPEKFTTADLLLIIIFIPSIAALISVKKYLS